jgi:secondary thiamine-phosphate synthase enzyme
MTRELVFSTKERKELIDVTDDVERVVEESDIEEGICLVFVPHATAAIVLNENETGLKSDLKKMLENWIPDENWQHNTIDNNATAHIASALIGQSRLIPIVNGKLALGTWQEIFLVELDGPRPHRKVIVNTIAGK